MQTPSPPRENEKNARLLRRLLGLALQYRGACVGVFALQVVLLGLGLSGLGLGGLAIDVIRHELDPGAPAPRWPFGIEPPAGSPRDRKSTRLNSSHVKISYAVFCLKKKTKSG